MEEPKRTASAEPSLDDVPEWVADAIFYQIFPDRFAASAEVQKPGHLEPWDAPQTRNGFKGGDLLGIRDKLDYLESLGINALYLNPIFQSASNHRYHTYDYFQVDPLLGGDEAFDVLLEAAHARGIRIVLDGVFNHTGRGFWPFHHLLENGKHSPYADWFHIKGWPLRAYEGKAPRYECWWDLPALPKLNIGNPETREYVLRVAEHWIQRGIDGWRLDVPQEIKDVEFWREFRRRVRAARPDAYLVGEIWDVAPEWLQGDRFDASMNHPFWRTALGFCASEAIKPGQRVGIHEIRRLTAREALDSIKEQTSVYPPGVVRSQLNLLSSHDTPRFLTLARGDHSALHLATLLQMTMPGAPCIFYGDEIGMEGGEDPGCRGGFTWTRKHVHEATYACVSRAVELRKREIILRQGDIQVLAARPGVISFLRLGHDTARDGCILVALNSRHERVAVTFDVPVGLPETISISELWDTSLPQAEIERGSTGKRRLRMELGSRSGRVIALKPPEGRRS